MKTLKSLFQFYINGSIHVALAICALVQITFIKLGVSERYAFLLFSFFGAIAAYNFVKYSKVSKLYHRRLNKSMKGIQILTWGSLLIFLYLASDVSRDTLLYMIPFILLTVLYTVPVFPNKKNLRSVAGIKIFIIAIVWAGITVLVPLTYAEEAISFDMSIEMIQRFLFIVVMMLPFEIRDLAYDDEKLVTVPQKIGITKTKVFGSALLVLFLLLTAVKDELSPIEILSTILVTTISLLFLWGTDKKQSEYYCSFWVESVPVMWLLIVLILKELFA